MATETVGGKFCTWCGEPAELDHKLCKAREAVDAHFADEDSFCGWCGEKVDDGDHATCEAARNVTEYLDRCDWCHEDAKQGDHSLCEAQISVQDHLDTNGQQQQTGS